MTKKKLIIKGKHPMPEFKSIEEESDFWDTHDPLEYGTWEEVDYKELLEDAKERSRRKVSISLRVEPELLRLLKEAAKQHGIPYQRFVREILWSASRRLRPSRGKKVRT